MSDEKIVYRLLYHILIEIRLAVREDDPRLPEIAYHLSDLMHNVPLMIVSLHEGRLSSYSEVLEFIFAKAKGKGMTAWLTNAVEDIKESEAARIALYTNLNTD